MDIGSPESDSIAMLDAEECERARVRRDRRYDGRFFSGVRTTRIYCRPVCPVPSSSARCRRRRLKHGRTSSFSQT
jgi:AraC family transcriptional regulator of adaptative response / DNA-3-methyladenine glycosylase II